MSVGMRDKNRLLHLEVTGKIIRAFYDVFDEVKPGLAEVVYQRAIPFALRDLGLHCQCEVSLPVHFRGNLIGNYRADLIVEGKVIVETKAATKIIPAHEAQLFNYMQIANVPVGLILNFSKKPEFQRYIISKNS